MKRRLLKSISVFGLTLFLLAGCGKKNNIDLPNVGILTKEENDGEVTFVAAQKDKDGIVTLTPATGYEAPVITEEKAGKKQRERLDVLKAEKNAAGITQTAIERCMRQQEGRYMYDMMDARLHSLYAELLLIIKAHAEDILISTTDEDDLQTTFMCVFQDHPELFWIEGYSYSRYSNQSGKVFSFTFSGKYSYNVEECKKLQQSVDDWVDKCIWGLPAGADDYEKVKYAYQYIIYNTDYVPGARDNQNIISVMTNGESVCQGYAKALQYVLGEMGVPCTMVVGKVKGGEGHAWDLVSINGAYYYVDPTWGDAGYLSASGLDVSSQGEVNYNYLNVTSDEIAVSHVPDNVVAMPHCVATEDNYYVREGRFFSSYDFAALKKLFDEAMHSGGRYVAFKCADNDSYWMCVHMILEEQEIFSLLPDGVRSVDYTTSDELKVLSFWF